MCNKSESIKELATALGKLQAEIKPAEMNSSNPFLKNKYADLGSIIKAAKPALTANGLSYSQLVTGDGGQIGITTILMHVSGQWLQSTMMLNIPTDRGLSAAQSAGAIISYMRRYSLSSALGLYSDEDNDGNDDKAHPKKAEKGNGNNSWTPEQIKATGLDQSKHAVMMLNLATVLSENSTPEQVKAWVQLYTSARSKGTKTERTAEEAASMADSAFKTEIEG